MNLFGVRTRIHWSWWVFVSLLLGPGIFYNFYGFSFLIWSTLNLTFLVIGHELTHALVAKYLYNYKTKSIVLFLLGGVSLIEIGDRFKPREEIVISLAGPIFNILISIPVMFFSFLIYPHPMDGIWLHHVWVLNLFMGLGNLIPAYPMDGGRILRASIAACDKKFSYSTATKIAFGASYLFIASILIFGVLVKNPFVILLGGIILFVTMKEYLYLKERGII